MQFSLIIRAFGVAIGIAVGTLAAMAQAAQGDVLVRVGTLTPEVVSYVARVGQEREITAPAGTDIFRLVSDYCGSANARRYYLPLFIAANGSNEEIKGGRTILEKEAKLRLPACLYAQESLTAVGTTTAGPQWQNPKVISEPFAAVQLEASQRQHTTKHSGRDVQIQGGSQTSAGKTISMAKLRGQSIDFKELERPRADKVPPELGKADLSIINQVDSRRLQDAAVYTQYARLAQAALASIQRPSAEEMSQPPPEPVMRQADAFERALRTQDVVLANPINDFTRIPTGSQIISSAFAPGRYAFSVNPDVVDPETAAREIADIARRSDPISAASVGSKYQPYFAVPQSTLGSASCDNTANRPWPFDHQELKKVLELRKRLGIPPKAGHLLILDTGFPPSQVGKIPFEKRWFIKKSGVPDETQEPYVWTALRPPEYFFDGFKHSSHGVSVLTMALGGVDTLKDKVLEEGMGIANDMVITLMGYRKGATDLELDGRAVLDTLAASNWGRVEVDIVNLSLSLEYKSVVGDPGTLITSQRHILYVFAAGNERKDLSEIPELPASWGGAKAHNVITVGGVNPDFTYATFSNSSSVYVDIAAPACGVPTLAWNGAVGRFDAVTLEGTSLAAPLVSFAANLLQGDYKNMGRLKARLLASGRYSDDLRGKVRSQRVLDIPTTLATHFDVVRGLNGAIRYGRVIWPESGYSICGTRRFRDREPKVLQLSFSDADLPRVRGVFGGPRIEEPLFPDKDCRLVKGELPDLTFREAVPQQDGIKLADAVAVKIRETDTITFCDLCYVWTD